MNATFPFSPLTFPFTYRDEENHIKVQKLPAIYPTALAVPHVWADTTGILRLHVNLWDSVPHFGKD